MNNITGKLLHLLTGKCGTKPSGGQKAKMDDTQLSKYRINIEYTNTTCLVLCDHRSGVRFKISVPISMKDKFRDLIDKSIKIVEEVYGTGGM